MQLGNGFFTENGVLFLFLRSLSARIPLLNMFWVYRQICWSNINFYELVSGFIMINGAAWSDIAGCLQGRIFCSAQDPCRCTCSSYVCLTRFLFIQWYGGLRDA